MIEAAPKILYILGYSGHAYTVIDVALSNDFSIRGYFDTKKNVIDPYRLHFLGYEHETNIKKITKEAYVFASIGSNVLRRKTIDFIEANALNQILLVDPSASVSSMALIGDSTLIAPKAVINSMAVIGKGCIVNSGALIEHECKIGDFTHIAPGAVLAGDVTVGSNVFVGANSVIKQGVTIGNDVVIGAGAVILRNIPDGQTWVGNPGKMIS
ncbi:acetyltransferase [Pricia sp.]|uniref:acetyltransferase n=1 Tax=Pricia sp. TaxID=2268138 RepID=UPI00359416F3